MTHFINGISRSAYDEWYIDSENKHDIRKGVQSNTTMSIKVYLKAILDNYMFRPLLVIFRLSSRELKVLLYTLRAHVVQRSLHTSLIAYCNFHMWWYALTIGTIGSGG